MRKVNVDEIFKKSVDAKNSILVTVSQFQLPFLLLFLDECVSKMIRQNNKLWQWKKVASWTRATDRFRDLKNKQRTISDFVIQC